MLENNLKGAWGFHIAMHMYGYRVTFTVCQCSTFNKAVWSGERFPNSDTQEYATAVNHTNCTRHNHLLCHMKLNLETNVLHWAIFSHRSKFGKNWYLNYLRFIVDHDWFRNWQLLIQLIGSCTKMRLCHIFLEPSRDPRDPYTPCCTRVESSSDSTTVSLSWNVKSAPTARCVFQHHGQLTEQQGCLDVLRGKTRTERSSSCKSGASSMLGEQALGEKITLARPKPFIIIIS